MLVDALDTQGEVLECMDEVGRGGVNILKGCSTRRMRISVVETRLQREFRG